MCEKNYNCILWYFMLYYPVTQVASNGTSIKELPTQIGFNLSKDHQAQQGSTLSKYLIWMTALTYGEKTRGFKKSRFVLDLLNAPHSWNAA